MRTPCDEHAERTLITSIVILYVLATNPVAISQEPDAVSAASAARLNTPAIREYLDETDGVAESQVTPTRRALILCGHPGTEVYRQAYRQSAEQIRTGLLDGWGFSAEHVWVRDGIEPEDGAELIGFRGPATREAIAADVTELKENLAPDDTVWVIVIGHSHFDGRDVLLNLPGRDMNQTDFGNLFEDLHCREQVFFVTVPASGHFIRGLSRQGRVVITATEADAETNATRFHRHLASVLQNRPDEAGGDRNADGRDDDDRDEDGRITLLDLYLTVVRRVMTEYREGHLIPTEHALLDDNGDGRGTELQLDDLEPELGGRAVQRPLSVVIRPPGDGALAASILMQQREEVPVGRNQEP